MPLSRGFETSRHAGNTRVISQKALDHFRSSLAARQSDPYSVLLRRNKLPMALLDDAANPNLRKVSFVIRPFTFIEVLQRSHIVETEPYLETFGPKAQRKKPRLDVGTFEELSQVGAAAADKAEADASEAQDGTLRGILVKLYAQSPPRTCSIRNWCRFPNTCGLQ